MADGYFAISSAFVTVLCESGWASRELFDHQIRLAFQLQTFFQCLILMSATDSDTGLGAGRVLLSPSSLFSLSRICFCSKNDAHRYLIDAVEQIDDYMLATTLTESRITDFVNLTVQACPFRYVASYLTLALIRNDK